MLWNTTCSLSISLFMFHLISFRLYFIVHVSSHFLHSALHWSWFIAFTSVLTSLIMFHSYFLQSTVYLIHFIYHSPSHSYLPYYHAVSLDKLLIVDRYSLLKAELRWFYYFLSPCIKQEVQRYRCGKLLLLEKRRRIFNSNHLMLVGKTIFTDTHIYILSENNRKIPKNNSEMHL